MSRGISRSAILMHIKYDKKQLKIILAKKILANIK